VVAVFAATPSGFSGSLIGKALASGQFRMFLAIDGGSAIALGLGWSVCWQVGREYRLKTRNKTCSQDGSAILEFALLLPIMLFFALLMVQSSLLMGGYLCVNYAAFCSARSAAVYIPANLSNTTGQESLADDVEGPNNINLGSPARSLKLGHIRSAAVWATMPISNGNYDEIASRADVLTSELQNFFQQNGQARPRWLQGDYLGKKLAYAEQYTTVTLTDADGTDLADQAGNGFYRYGEHEDIHLVITHNLYLAVPYANWLMWKLDGAKSAGDEGEGRYALEVRVSCTLTNEGTSDTIEDEEFETAQ
jgi:hypothetical protein